MLEKYYQLELSNGIGWNITAMDGVEKWLDDFAYVMMLNYSAVKSSHLNNIIFCKKGNFEKALEYYCADNYDIGKKEDLINWSFHDNYKSVRTWIHKSNQDSICEIDYDGSHKKSVLSMWTSLYPIYQKVQNLGGLPLHAALVEFNGNGVVLAASGRTGKTTSCHRLPSHWKPLGDDEMLVVFDPQNGYNAHPLPTWSAYWLNPFDKKWNVKYSVPISAVFFLMQSNKDEVIRLDKKLAVVNLIKSSKEVYERFTAEFDEQTKRNTAKSQFINSCEFAKKISSFILRQTIDGRFWEQIEKIFETTYNLSG